MIVMVRRKDVFLTCILAMHVIFSSTVPAVSGDPSECRSLMDLFIVIDGSDSISYDDFKLLQNAIASLIPHIDLGPNKARIGMLVYSSHVPASSEHTFSHDPKYLLNAAKTLEHPRDGTNTALGIQHMKNIFKTNGRPNVPWVCVVITDGISKNPILTIEEADEAARMGISMFAVGIGHKIALQELIGIASTENQVMAIQNFGELQNMLTSMMFRICPCPLPPVLPLAKCSDGPRAIGTVRTYQCQEGYLLRGNPSITCQADFTWTPLSKDFQCIPCPQETPIIEHGTCSGGDYLIGTVRTYTCNPGYRAVGKANIQCLPDATWSLPDFSCLPCGETPMIKHGKCGGGDYTIGAVRTFTCNPGYRAMGEPNIKCMDDPAWPAPAWSTPSLQCVPCGDTPVIPHGSCGGGDYIIGAVRTLSCDSGYKAVGNRNIHCIDKPEWETPRWSIPDFSCLPCGEPPVISHGTCGGGDYVIGAIRRFTCDAGYRAIGNPAIQCLDNPSWTTPAWSKPEFECVPCGETPTIPHGSCGGDKYHIGAVRTFTCDKGYKAVGNPNIQCLDNSAWARPAWSKPEFQCIPCGETPVIPHGSCGGIDNTIGSVRLYSCDIGYKAVGQSEIRCIDDPAWTAPRWTTPNFQCIPCGDTPTIPHGSCGGGDFTIGAVRTFVCDAGYRAIGKPNIKCMDEPSWLKPAWSVPDLKCVPCGDTPNIPHGSCGGGDYTIGSIRSFTCHPGYKAVGNANIKCMDDASLPGPYWSKPELQCIPCGDTPTIQHGVCGGGDFTIGSVRTFVCNPGFKAVGIPTIKCIDNVAWAQPAWSKPDFQCIPCGDTPTIPHGTCGGGDFTIGAVRKFVCDAGYKAIGNPDIQCLDNVAWDRPAWSKPDFRCAPCGETPVVSHGKCGGGDYTIGSVRSFACDAGYKAFGNPTIQCLDNPAWMPPAWSKPEFQCISCGDTPTIPHGLCGGGDFTIGAVRKFVCDAGYKAIGNPDIQCLDNVAWDRPAWSKPDFRCAPCGETPVIAHGSCGGGDYTIGAIRKISCDRGYLAVGNPDIMCMDDPTWSEPRWSLPDVKCTPCGETPTVLHATCGAGDYLIGSKRKFTCETGYVLQGNPEIECLPTAKWSLPSVQCLACGSPPMVPNAYTGTGPSLIGSTREYFCETGYQMFGRGQVTCLADGQWEKPQFSCQGIKTTPSPLSNDPSVCDACRFLNGVGYNNHPFDCNQYVQCFMGNKGMEPVYRRCPFGSFWDQNVLTCRPSHEVNCPHDQCKDLTLHSYKHNDPDLCCAYWKCKSGRSYGECCGEGKSYNPAQRQCITDYKCLHSCPFVDEMPACDKRPTSSETMFEQHIGNNYWVAMPCAPGTAFNPVDCECSLFLMTIPGKTRQQVCKPELYLPFTDGFGDKSGKNVYVKPENVSVHNGAAYFNGNSRILINRFANTEFVGDLVIKFRYNEFKQGDYYQQLQALVTNGDCGDDPSIVIAKMPGYVLLGAKTDVSKSFALPTLDKEWKEVIYLHNEKTLEGKVCGASMSKWSYGPIAATHCSIQIGYGNGLTSYVGLIDDLYIYQCRPRAALLNIAYR